MSDVMEPYRVLCQTISEAAWQKTVTEYLTLRGWLWYHTHRSDRSEPGFPDIVAIRPPRLVWCELKKETGQPSPEQYEWLWLGSQIPGLECYLWRPSSWPEVEKVLQ